MHSLDLVESRWGQRGYQLSRNKKGPYAIEVPSPRKTYKSICTTHVLEQIEKYLGTPEKQGVVQHYSRFPQEVVESPLVEIVKTKTRHSLEPLTVTTLL